MSANLIFDFSVNRNDKTIHVKRQFAADLNLVWEAWTNPEILDQWWAPKPYQTRTKSMDFREGGYWLYAMISPESVAHWCRADYKKIADKKSFSALDAFCNENGQVNQDFPRSSWTNEFHENSGLTTVHVTIAYDSLESLEKIIEMGFKDGFTMALGNLDQYIAEQFKQKEK